MKSKEIILSNPKGIHLRPATMIVETAKKYQSSIELELEGNPADASDIMQVISLGAAQGASIKVSVDGPDEEDAMQAMENIFAINFNDEK